MCSPKILLIVSKYQSIAELAELEEDSRKRKKNSKKKKQERTKRKGKKKRMRITSLSRDTRELISRTSSSSYPLGIIRCNKTANFRSPFFFFFLGACLSIFFSLLFFSYFSSSGTFRRKTKRTKERNDMG